MEKDFLTVTYFQSDGEDAKTFPDLVQIRVQSRSNPAIYQHDILHNCFILIGMEKQKD